MATEDQQKWQEQKGCAENISLDPLFFFPDMSRPSAPNFRLNRFQPLNASSVEAGRDTDGSACALDTTTSSLVSPTPLMNVNEVGMSG